MHGSGYLRRKVTRNLGKTNATFNPRDKGGGGSLFSGFINPLGKPDLVDNECPVIFDDNGMIHSTWKYCLMGEREGWLTRNGYHRQGQTIYHHFWLNPPVG